MVHYGFIESFFEELGTKYNIYEIAFDRWGVVQMVQNLEGMGFTVVPFGQGFKDMSHLYRRNRGVGRGLREGRRRYDTA